MSDVIQQAGEAIEALAPYHDGERRVQTRAGTRAFAERIGRQVLRDAMPQQHRDFFPELPFIIAGSLDAARRPWASLLVGRPGFVSSPDPRTLRIEATPVFGDPIRDNLKPGAPLGLVGVQLETRRRNRMNGSISAMDETGFTVTVGQSFGNCPQYIQVRQTRFCADPASVGQPRRLHPLGRSLSARALAMIAGADTFFIASASPAAGTADRAEGVDVNHRGGRPGFVRITDENGQAVLTSPDFVGNSMFQTLGNIDAHPFAGLLFVDFESGDVVSLTGEASILWDAPEIARFAGAERLLQFRPTAGVLIEDAVPLRWSAPEPAPQNAATGRWEDVGPTDPTGFRSYTVTRIVDESPTVRSFHLRPTDGERIAPHLPGQFLPIAFALPGGAAPLRRTYTLSNAADGEHYRLTVKREPGGQVSNGLHDHLAVGDTLSALAPRGDFTLSRDGAAPVALISAGIGITPMMAMLEHLTGGTPERQRYPDRPVWFIHGARHGGEQVFAAQVLQARARHAALVTHIRYSTPRPQDVAGHAFDSIGHIDQALLATLLPLATVEVYLCGPAGFMQAVYEALLALGVDDARIYAEAFGPAGLRRQAAGTGGPQAAPVDAAEVHFSRSGLTRPWTAAAGTLLDLAEHAGIDAPWSCRYGHCGTCAARVLDGAVTYTDTPGQAPPAGHALVCSALPASRSVVLDL